MRNLWNNLKKWQRNGIIVGGLVLVFGVIAVIVVGVFNIINSEPKVQINFGTDSNIPTGEIKNVREILVEVIKNNTLDFDDNLIYEGVARNYEEEKSDGLTTANFVVDFDAIKESYAVSVVWPDPNDGSPNIIVSCPIFDSKYPETPCKTEVNDSTDIISYLPHEGNFGSDKKYNISPRYDGDMMYLELTTNGDSYEALEFAKKWVDSLPLEEKSFMYYVPNAEQYIQANHANTKDKNVNQYLPYYIPGLYNMYPITDENGGVLSIMAELAGCTSYQTDQQEEQVNLYLSMHEINYPVEYSYCMGD